MVSAEQDFVFRRGFGRLLALVGRLKDVPFVYLFMVGGAASSPTS